jgi:hypothetical protein
MTRLWLLMLPLAVPFLLASAIMAQLATAQPLLWPLELQPALSSTFGETRATAFHFGIDLKTWGKTGYPVRAIDDGWILRVRTSPWGYGRAVYQRLSDGRIAVYAHLLGFAEPIKSRVLAAQQASRQYSVQLWPEEGEIPVRRGQVIARSGSSGAGPPHLHVEIRDADNVPHNPLQQGLGPVADTTPPTLRRLLLMPLSASSRIDGGYVPVVVSLRPDGDGFVANRPVRIWGSIGLAIDSYDRADLAPNKLAVLRHTLSVDDQVIFASTYEHVSYADGHLVALDRIRPLPIAGVFSTLFRRPGNRLSFYEGERGQLVAGGEGLAPGPHKAVVWAEDLAGNKTRASLQLQVSAFPTMNWARLFSSEQEEQFVEADFSDADDERLQVEISAVAESGNTVVQRTMASVGSGPFTWALPEHPHAGGSSKTSTWSMRIRDEAGNEQSTTLALQAPTTISEPFSLHVTSVPRPRHVLLQINSSKPLRQTPDARVGAKKLSTYEVAPGKYTAMVPLHGIDADSVVVDLQAVAANGSIGTGRLVLSGRGLYPGQERIISLLDGDLQLQSAAGSVFEILYPQALAITVEASEGLEAAGRGCEIGPADVAFDERARISMGFSGEADGLGVYADDGQGRWVFIGADLDGPNRLSAGVRAFGRFALLRDAMSPTILALEPESGSVVNADIAFSADIADAGSGIKREEDIVLELDGLRLISEYDPDTGQVMATADELLAAGAHHLVLTLRDAAGNESVLRSDFISR